MIVTDGIRSLKRKWYANKLLRVIKDIGVYSKTVVWDGFRISVTAMDDWSNGRVKAPMGVVVICVKDDKVTICSAEYWLSVFSPERDLYCINKGVPSDQSVEQRNYPDTVVAVNELTPSYTAFHVNSKPVLLPQGNSESVLSLNSVDRGYTSLVAELVQTMFNSDASQNTRSGYVYEVDSANATTPLIQTVASDLKSGKFRGVKTTIAKVLFSLSTSKPFIATIWDMETSGATIYTDVAWTGIPSALYPSLTGSTAFYLSWVQGQILGSYAYAESKDDGINLLSVVTCHNLDYRLEDYFIQLPAGTQDPAKREWRMWYTLVILDKGYEELNGDPIVQTVYTVNAKQFLPVLQELTTEEILGGSYDPELPWDITDSSITIDWEIASAVLSEHLAFPNSSKEVPNDSVMFHGLADEEIPPEDPADDPTTEERFGIYSWTRTHGAIVYSSEGIKAVDMIVPQVVTDNEGTRPGITYAGNGLYLCVSEDIGTEVRALHVGSPFSGWTELPFPDTTLLHVKPISVTAGRVVLAGVVKDSVDGETVYNFATLDTPTSEEDLPKEWTILGSLTVEAFDSNTWDVSFYGDGEYTALQSDYPSPPPAVPQTFYMTTSTLA